MSQRNDWWHGVLDKLEESMPASPDDWPTVYINRDTGKVYNPHHEAEVQFVNDHTTWRFGLAKGGEGGGKALALDTPLPTPTGWITMGEVKAGDELFDENGRACQVLATSEVMTGHDCYQLIFDHQSVIVADAGHQWLVSHNQGLLQTLTTTEIAADFQPDAYTIPAKHKLRHIAITGLQVAESMPVKCVSVSSKSQLFLAGKGMIPTHNSVAGIIKTLERIRFSQHGIFVSPNLPHFKRSLWPEFQRWCPWEFVTDRYRYCGAPDWVPYEPLILSFKTGGKLYCGGIENPRSWRGPNVHFAQFDEAHYAPNRQAMSVLNGRIRLQSANGWKPQMWFTTTPEMNWLFDHFGPVAYRCLDCGFIDPLEFSRNYDIYRPELRHQPMECPNCQSTNAIEYDDNIDFKIRTYVISLFTKDNEQNLSDNYVEDRGASLTEAEKDVLLWAKWGSLEQVDKLIEEPYLWDRLLVDDIAPLDKKRDVLVIGVDAGWSDDWFAIVGVTLKVQELPVTEASENTDVDLYRYIVQVRFARYWIPPVGGKLDFQGTEFNPGPLRFLRQMCQDYTVGYVAYDPTQLHDAMTTMGKETYKNRPLAQFVEIPQQGRVRETADLMLHKRINHGTIEHDGDGQLRQQIVGATVEVKRDKVTNQVVGMRIKKQSSTAKNDLVVALSMASHIAVTKDVRPRFKTVKFMHLAGEAAD